MDYAGTPYPALERDDPLYKVKDYTEDLRTALLANGGRVWLANNSFTASSPPASYPLGVSIFYDSNVGGWPFTFCGIKTEKHHPSGFGIYQTCTSNGTGGRKARSYAQASNAWTAWKDVYTP